MSTFAVTFFSDHSARAKTEEKLTLTGLAELVGSTKADSKDALPWLKLARFGNKRSSTKHSLRYDGNVAALSGVAVDYDREEMSPEEAAERLDKAGVEAIVYTSPSHTDQRPRWRVCCPFSTELPPDRHYQMVARLNGLLGGVLATESFTLSQSYYYGAVGGNPEHRVILVPGTATLDRCDELDLTAIGKPDGGNGRRAPGGNPEAEIGDIEVALDAIPNPIPSWDVKGGTWNEWNTIGMAVWRASGGSDEGLKAFDAWSRKWPAKYDGDETEFRWNHYAGSPPNRIGFGTLVHLARQAQPGWTAPSTTRGLPEIRVRAGSRHEAADAGLAAMLSAGVAFYQRDQKLVRVARLKAKTTNGETILVPGIMPITAPSLMRALGQSAQWRKYNERKKGWLACDPPDPVAQQILSMVGEWPFPPIRGVIGTQTMRPDGTLLTKPGYDAKTGFVLFEPPQIPAIPATPTKEDAKNALKLIDALFDEFPFTDDASRSVALSLDMSLILRPAMSVVPLHVANAPEGGTGKSYLFDIVSMHAIGEACPAIARGGTYEETEKRLIGAALEGRTLILLDNCNGELRSEFLCQAIERPMIKPRPLGTSVMPNIPNGFVCGANGNNIETAEDLVRRALECGLDADMELPYRRTFKRDPVRSVLADRGRYVAAVLTIALAYIRAGRPERPAPLASFEEWSDLVRGSLIWLGRTDPVNTMNSLRSTDPARDVRANVFAALAKALAGKFAVPDIVRASKGDENLRGVLLAVVKSKRGDDADISPESLGWWLRRNSGRVAGCYKLVRHPEERRWEVKVKEQPEGRF